MLSEKKVLLLEKEKPFFFANEQLETGSYKSESSLFSALVLPLNLLHFHLVKLPLTTSDEDIEIQAEIQFYKEGGLNPDKEYVIDYVKNDIGEEWLVDLFAVEKSVFDEYIQSFDYDITAVDLAFPRFIAYEALYLESIQSTGVELIFHLSDTEASVGLFSDGKYIGHRSVSSVELIAKKVGIEQAKVKELLETNGLLQENYTLDDMLFYNEIVAVLSKDIEKIVYLVNHRRRFFKFDTLNLIRVDFNGLGLEGLDTFFANFGLESKVVPLYESEVILPSHYYVPMLYATAVEEKQELTEINLSALKRKKSLLRYRVVHYSVFLFLILVILASVSTYMEYEKSQKALELKKIEKRYKSTKARYLKLVKAFKKFKQQHIDLLNKKKEKEERLFVLENTYNILPLAEDLGRSRQKFMNDTLEVLKKYRLNVSRISQSKDQEIELVVISLSQNRDGIAKFIQDMLKKGYGSVSTRKIYFEDGLYKSLIRIKK